MKTPFTLSPRARSTAIPLTLALALSGAFLSTGWILAHEARTTWSNQARSDCNRLSTGIVRRIELLQQKMRSLVILYGASEKVTRAELLFAVENMEINANSTPLADTAYIRDGRVEISTEISGPLVPGSDIFTVPEVARARAVCLEQPGATVMSPVFMLDGRRCVALLAQTRTQLGETGVLVSLVRIDDFFLLLKTVEIPPGLGINLRESGGANTTLLEIEAPGVARERVLEVREIGFSGWEFDWGVTDAYLGGPATGLGRMVGIGGALTACLLAFLIRMLLLRNLEVTQRVEERTSELNAALESLRHNETALTLAKEKAEAANRAKSAFLSSMSHELRTPLNAILGFAQIMNKEEDCTPGQHRHLDIILRSGNHLLNLINDVLSIAKVESHKAVPELSDFDLGSLMNEIVDMLRMRAEGKGLKLFLDQTSSFPRFVRCDVVKLRQVLINIVGNAVKFTDKGHVSIRLFTQSELQKDGRTRLVFEIADTGPGMAPDDLERIFRPFEQAKNRPDVEGTGLGLSLAQSYIGLMGGDITVTSEQGKGTVFRFTILCAPVDDAGKTAEKTAEAKVSGVTGASECRILIVDDQLENRLLLRTILKKFGFPLREAENGAVALAAVEEWKPHLVLLDRRMPVMSGEEAVKRLRADPRHAKLPVVAVTAQAYQEEMQEMMDAGCDDFIKKPFRADDIFAVIEKFSPVRFTRETPAKPSVTSGEGNVDLRGILAGVTAEHREAMRRALDSADPDAVKVIAEQYPGLNDALKPHLDAFRYDIVAEALS